MRQLIFSTGNSQKIAKGKAICKEYGIELLQKDFAVDEVQSEEKEYVAREKAKAVFAAAQKPIVISDDSWAFLGLNGFPGTYAKAINHWLSAEDLVRIMDGITDRRVAFTQTIVYQDHTQQKLFSHQTIGIALTKPSGNSGDPLQKMISMEPDAKTSISEILDNNNYYSGASTLQVWHDFAAWFIKRENA